MPQASAGYSEHVNPPLADLLAALRLDRTYVRGEGLWLTDAQGRRVLDFTSQFGALPLGYNPEEMWRALERCRAEKIPSFAQPSLLEPAGALAARLVACAPHGLQRVTFVNSGAEAVEVALKLAFSHTGRRAILSTEGGFHGKTMGALSATGRSQYQAPFGLPAAGFERVGYDDIEALEQALSRSPERYAAFLVEPVQGEAGVIVPRPDYLARARALCRRFGVLLIVDEVQTGLGRTGRLFATGDDVEPDIVTLAKALGGGLLPFGACLCRADVYTDEFALAHSSTFAGNGLGAALGLALLDELSDPQRDLLGQVRQRGEQLSRGLTELAARHPRLIAAVRGTGLMLGLELANLRLSSTDNMLAVAAEQGRLASVLASYLLNVHGVRASHSLNQGNVLRVQPALTVSAGQCAQFLAALGDTLSVFDTLDSARVYAGLHGQPLASSTTAPLRRQRPLQPAASAVPTFAMLYHPPHAGDFAHFDPTLGALPQALIEAFARAASSIVEPFATARTRFVSKSGAVADGVFIVLPHTAEGLCALTPKAAQRTYARALAIASEHGARLLGLGAYTSVMVDGGKALRGHGFGVTNGNALTALACVRSLERAWRGRGHTLSDTAVAVLGAGGSVGRAAALLCARRAGSVICVGNPNSGARGRQRLEQVAFDLSRQLSIWARDRDPVAGALLERVRSLPESGDPARLRELLGREGLLVCTQDLTQLRDTPCAIAAISSPRPIVEPAHLAEGALFCDASRPYALSRGTREARTDVQVLAAGHVALPQATDVAPLGLERSQLYACIAETVLLAWEGVNSDFSVGADLPLCNLLTLDSWADKHGLRFV